MKQRSRTFAFDFAAFLLGANVMAQFIGPIGSNPFADLPLAAVLGFAGLLVAVQVAGVRVYGPDDQLLASIRGLGLGGSLQATGVLLHASMGVGVVATHVLLLGVVYAADMLMTMNDRRAVAEAQRSAA